MPLEEEKPISGDEWRYLGKSESECRQRKHPSWSGVSEIRQ
jgi:hypothetical protein